MANEISDITANFPVFTTTESAKSFLTSNFSVESYTTRTVDTTGPNGLDDWAIRLVLNTSTGMKRDTTIATKAKSLVLKVAFTSLVTNRTVKRMVIEKKRKNGFTGLFYQWRVCEDFSPG